MIRRSFRFGLKLGLIAGIGFALVKALQSRRPDTDAPLGAPDVWPPLQPTSASPTPVTTPVTSRVATAVVEETEETQPPAAAAAAEQWADASPGWLEEVAPVTEPEPPAPDRPLRVVKKAAVAPIADTPVAKKAAPVKKAAKAAAKKVAAKKAKKAAPAPWVDPAGGICPTSHPVKAKLASQIFHLPGMLNYARATPDRCYRDADAAEADGLRPAKR